MRADVCERNKNKKKARAKNGLGKHAVYAIDFTGRGGGESRLNRQSNTFFLLLLNVCRRYVSTHMAKTCMGQDGQK